MTTQHHTLSSPKYGNGLFGKHNETRLWNSHIPKLRQKHAGAAQLQFDGYKMEAMAAVFHGTPLPPNQTPK